MSELMVDPQGYPVPPKFAPEMINLWRYWITVWWGAVFEPTGDCRGGDKYGDNLI